jgi:hypothetical protein
MTTILAGGSALLMLVGPALAQGAEPVGDLSGGRYQTCTVELPRKAWTVGIKLHDANGVASEQSIVVLDGFSAESLSSRTRGYPLDAEKYGSAIAYNYLIWFVPDSKLKEWLEQPALPAYFDPTGQTMQHSAPESTGPRDGVAMEPALVDDSGRHALLLANMQEIRVDELSIFIYAPACERIELSVDKSDYRHIVNGVFQEGVDVLRQVDIPFELSRIETPSHLVNIVIFPESRDLGFLNAAGEVIYPAEELALEAAERKEDAAESDNAEYADKAAKDTRK